MPSPIPVIDAFADLPGTVEIVAVGRVRQPSGTAVEFEVEIVLAERTSEGSFEPRDVPSVRWVGSGQLDLMTVGSQWQMGVLVGQSAFPRHEAHVGFKQFVTLGTPIVSADRSRFLPIAPVADAPCLLLDLRPTAVPSPDSLPSLGIVPVMEVLRAIFGVGSGLLLEMFDGVRDGVLAKDRGLFNRKRSGIEPDGVVRIVCHRSLTKREAIVVACYLSDPLVRRCYDLVFQSLVVQVDFKNRRPAFAKTKSPFGQISPSAGDAVRLVFEGAWIDFDNGRDGSAFRRFLLTRILSLDLPLRFNVVEVHVVGPTSRVDDTLPPPTGRHRMGKARRIRLVAGRPPSPGRLPVEIGSDRLPLPIGVGVTVIEVRENFIDRPSMRIVEEDQEDEATGSTAGCQTGADPDTRRVIVRRRESETSTAPDGDELRTPADARALTRSALEAASVEAGWSLTEIDKPSAWSSSPVVSARHPRHQGGAGRHLSGGRADASQPA